ncbi:MAG TPA: hypothetical protein VGG30_02115 [Pirellulales bacterium]|jgi:hypothetical protein
MSAGFYATVACNVAAATAALCVAWCCAATAVAQSPSSTPGQTPGLQGTGPRVDVQTSPNGTIDVGGTGGTDLNMTGENFRGSFGASRSQPGWSVAPSLPRSSFPLPFAAPNFNPSLPGPSAPSDTNSQVDQADLAAYPDLILPRFRNAVGGSASLQRQTDEVVSPGTRVEAWRYRFSGGRWWYWQPSEAWLYWDGTRWQPFTPRR